MESIISVPLVKKELRQNLRGHAALALGNVYLIGIFLAAVYAVFDRDPAYTPAWQIGGHAFWWLMAIQAVVAVVLGATVAAPSMTAETEQKTLDILASTPLSPRQVVWSKWLAAFMAGGAVLAMSLPVAAAIFGLGGVSPGLAASSWVLLYGALAIGAALGIYCSVAVGRTAAAVPLAVIGALGLTFAVAQLSDSSPAVAAFSPLGSVLRLGDGGHVPLFGAAVPVWVVPVVLWSGAMLALGEGAAQRLTPPALRRVWGPRWQFAAFAFLLALAAVGSLMALGGEGVWCVGST